MKMLKNKFVLSNLAQGGGPRLVPKRELFKIIYL